MAEKATVAVDEVERAIIYAALRDHYLARKRVAERTDLRKEIRESAARQAQAALALRGKFASEVRHG